ncbi:flagellar protein FlaG [Bacillus sp. V3B]|uniref:flagellar protein FlaG n=1 Tax=Bacillus sp. V3B TaxID=2804915 RepID=UPI002811D1EE|nr:flagellar protein FlaG [Bacillus sp. V3B]
MMIERISNQNGSGSTRIPAVERVNPSRPVEDILKHPEEPSSKEPSKQGYKEMDKEKVEEVVQGMNDFIQPINTSIQFVLHDKLNDYYVAVVDDATDEVIKEIPSKKLLDTYANMMEFVGLLVDKKI